MARIHVDHKDLLRFAEDRVNLPKDKADEYRAQANRLGDRLQSYLNEHPDFSLKRIQIAGSLAKGTALKTINDIDMGCYISGASAPTQISALLEYLAERLRKAYPNFSPDQVTPNTYSVTVSFRGSGLDVDVVPILYDGDPRWFGNLVSQEDGSFLKTSIPLHIEFARTRKKLQPKHFAQVVRLAKFWTRIMKQERDGFRFKSFMVEMVVAHLCDQGVDLSDYPEALQAFLTYIARTDFREKIVFTDYYAASTVGAFSEPVQIIDPVNGLNNVSRLYTAVEADAVVDAALDAGDAIDGALHAPTKHETVAYWQKVFGPSFSV